MKDLHGEVPLDTIFCFQYCSHFLANISQYEGDLDFFKVNFAINQGSCLIDAGIAMCSDELFGAHSRT